MENESYKLAEEYVLAEIRKWPDDVMVCVDDMQDTDCIPVTVHDGNVGWDLHAVEQRGTNLFATYEKRNV